MLETILLTGFGPFASRVRNISAESIARLNGRERDGFVIKALELPVQFERAIALLKDAIQTERPAAVICTGIHDAPTGFRIELAAKNNRDYAIPDADGVQVQGEPVVSHGDPMLFSSLPVGAIKQAFDSAGLEAELSEDAGGFLCNAVFYWALTQVEPAGFLHLPTDPSQLGAAVQALEIAVEVTSKRLLAQHVEV